MSVRERKGLKKRDCHDLRSRNDTNTENQRNGRRIGGIEEIAPILSLFRLQDRRDCKIYWSEQKDDPKMAKRGK